MGGCIPLILPLGSAPGHKLQKPSKRCGIFQSLGTISFCSFLLRSRVKRGSYIAMPHSLNTLLPRSLRLGACERMISSFKRRFTRLQTSLWLLCVMLARGKLELIKLSPGTFTEVKWRRWYGNTNFSLPT